MHSLRLRTHFRNHTHLTPRRVCASTIGLRQHGNYLRTTRPLRLMHVNVALQLITPSYVDRVPRARTWVTVSLTTHPLRQTQ